jgi:histidine ammonia-lyase
MYSKVHGASKDTIPMLVKFFETGTNSVTDNPNILLKKIVLFLAEIFMDKHWH